MKHENFIYKPAGKSRLKDHDPDFTADVESEAEAQEKLRATAEEMAKYQDYLMAHETNGLIVIFQAMDGAGKDAAIKNVMSSLDPQGCEMKMFKAQTKKEMKHDYLWLAAQNVPARGQIGIFNRSYYEHVLADRIHPEKLEQQNLPKTGRDIWQKRFRHINNFEEYLFDEGIHVLKFFLNISKEQQRRKLLERIERPEKKWKFTSDDLADRELWDDYMKIYEDVFRHTSTKIAPWYIVPGNDRWFARALTAAIILEKLKSLHKSYPKLSEEQEKELSKAKKRLEKEAADE
jgi:PPK2 family polyphosphate:nucleotide phosphotransferase